MGAILSALFISSPRRAEGTHNMDTENVQTQAVAPVTAAIAPDAQTPAPNKPAVPTTPVAQTVEDVAALPEWAQKAIKDLRAESANHRKAKATAEQAAAQAAEQAAIEQGKWKELYEKAKPLAERATAAETFIAEMLEAETANIPDKLKPLIPQGDALTTLRWVQQAKAAGILAAPQAPRTDAGAAGANLARVETEAEKRERAARLGVDWRYLPN